MRMNKLSRILLGSILGLTVFWVSSCEHLWPPPSHHHPHPIIIEEPSASNPTLSVCKDWNGGSNTTESPYLNIIYQNGKWHFTHEFDLNCAINTIDVEVEIVGNNIIIQYETDDENVMNCICTKELQYEIENIPAGAYNIIIKMFGEVIYQQPFVFA